MASPGFFGLFNSHRALVASQTGLNLVNQNIANANTEGYSKQRADLEISSPYQPPTLQSGTILQVGQGVQVGALTRVRDNFLDQQFRFENSVSGKVDTVADIMSQLEGIVGEPSDTGLRNSLQAMFDSVQDLTINPESLAARTQFIQQATDFSSTIKQQGRQLLDLHENLVGLEGDINSFTSSELGIVVKQSNDTLATIANLNKEINVVVASGGAPNDLLDKRDQLLDELSGFVDVDIVNLPNSQVSVNIGGERVITATRLIDTLELVVNPGADAAQTPALLQTVSGGVDLTSLVSDGQVRGILDVAGANTTTTNVYGVFEELNAIFETLADAFNGVQQAGRDLNGNLPVAPFDEIFSLDAAYSGTGPRLQFLEVNNNLRSNPDRLALAEDDASFAGNFGGPGDSRNAQAMADLRNSSFATLNGQNFDTFHQTTVSILGTDSKSFQDRDSSQNILMEALDGRRQSVSGVNLDEETIDLIRFQRSFEAASRVVQTFNEIYQTILNMV